MGATAAAVGHVAEEELVQSPDTKADPIYCSGREKRVIYLHDELHLLVIQTVLSLLLNPHENSLERLYYAEFPAESNKLNVPFLLSHHLNHPGNLQLVPALMERAHEMGPAIMRLLKLLVNCMFQHQ